MGRALQPGVLPVIELGYMKNGRAVTYAEVEIEMLPEHLQPHVSKDTIRLIKEKESTFAGVTVQLWNRWDKISPKHVQGQRFTVKFEANE
jgi:hypothetical protein